MTEINSIEVKRKNQPDINKIIVSFRKRHGDRYDYSKTTRIIGRKVEIICKTHGSFMQSYSGHAAGSNCIKCSIEDHPNLQYKSKDKVIADFRKKHGDKYDYSKVNYRGAFSIIEIICKNHGSFFQQSNSHRRGSGCPSCANEKKDTFSRGKYSRVCSNGSSLYLVKMTSNDEIFYKIGITKDTLKVRFRKIRDYGFEEIFLIKGDAEFIWDLEKTMFKMVKDKKYQPKIKFCGHTECFSEIPNSVLKFMDRLKKTTQIQLIT